MSFAASWWAVLAIAVVSSACSDDTPKKQPDAGNALIDAVQGPDGPPGFSVIHGCAAGDYVVRTGAADRSILGGASSFIPKCMTIAMGESVTFMMDFGTHPLEPGLGPTYAGDPPGNPNTPITAKSNGNQDLVAGPFTAPGFYPFNCPTHEAFGMVGVVQVVP